MKLFEHQSDALKSTERFNRVAYYHDMGLGKTFTGAEKMMQLGARINLVVCQKSKIDDWYDHFMDNYLGEFLIFDLTDKVHLKAFMSYEEQDEPFERVGIINYDLVFRRPELKKLKDFTLMLDESSLIQNERSKRSKFILNLNPKNVILLSGTPTGGKYEKLWSQLHLLGWKISKRMFYDQYVNYRIDTSQGFPIMLIDGYKNEERLKKKMHDHGCHFLKTDEVFDLPKQVHNTIKISTTPLYRKFRKDSIVRIADKLKPAIWSEDPVTKPENISVTELVGDTSLTKMLYERQLCGQYNEDKLKVFRDLLESTDDRLIVFYNFNDEFDAMLQIVDETDKHVSVVRGGHKDLSAYENIANTVTFIQYQAGAMGLNLQKANKIIYFTPPLSSELFEQSKKRTHRIGQDRPCFYYYLTCKGSIEEKIYKTLAMRKDYTDKLFERGE